MPLNPAVVVVALPTPCGIEGLRRIKAATWKSRPIPVVAFSGLPDQEDMDLCYGAGANAYVGKPAGFSDLVRAVRMIDRFWCGVNRLPTLQDEPLALV